MNPVCQRESKDLVAPRSFTITLGGLPSTVPSHLAIKVFFPCGASLPTEGLSGRPPENSLPNTLISFQLFVLLECRISEITKISQSENYYTHFYFCFSLHYGNKKAHIFGRFYLNSICCLDPYIVIARKTEEKMKRENNQYY